MAEDALTATQNLNKICLHLYCAFQAGWLSFLSHSLTKKLNALVYFCGLFNYFSIVSDFCISHL